MAQKGTQIIGRPLLCLSLHLKVFARDWVAHNWRKFDVKKKSHFVLFRAFWAKGTKGTTNYCNKRTKAGLSNLYAMILIKKRAILAHFLFFEMLKN